MRSVSWATIYNKNYDIYTIQFIIVTNSSSNISKLWNAELITSTKCKQFIAWNIKLISYNIFLKFYIFLNQLDYMIF